MLAWCLVVEVVEETRSNIVWNDYFILKVTRSVCKAVSCCDEESIRGKFGMSDMVTHFVVLVSRFVVWNLSCCEVSNSRLTGI